VKISYLKTFKYDTSCFKATLSYKKKYNYLEFEATNQTFSKKEDPTRFLSVHCAFYPKDKMCSEKP